MECEHDFGFLNVGTKCTRCGKHKESILSERITKLQQQLTTAQEEIIRLRGALEYQRNYWDKEEDGSVTVQDMIIMRKVIDEALSTPPTGGLSELVDAVGRFFNLKDNHACMSHMDYMEDMNNILGRMYQVYNKVKGV